VDLAHAIHGQPTYALEAVYDRRILFGHAALHHVRVKSLKCKSVAGMPQDGVNEDLGCRDVFL